MPKDRILIVDDERFFCNLLENILKNKYETVVVKNGDEAIQALDQNQFDLILLDIVMPEMNGYHVCQQIKSTPQNKEIPVIFLTVKNDTEDEIQGLELGAVDYLTKPISPPIVLARVSTHIALYKANQQLKQHTSELEKLVAQRTVELTREIAEKQKIYEKLHFLANYDQLTQLPNRNLFNERLSYIYKVCERNKTSFSLLLIDLDRFKTVNDSLGHHIGDLLLEQVGNRLSKNLRGVDTIARLGGDEFTVTLTELKRKQDASIVAEKIIAALAQPFEIKDHTIHIGSSIGITSYPDDCQDINSLLKNADMAMYEVKKTGKNAYKFFSPAMTELANHRMELEKDLYAALKNNQLYLKYQPIIAINSDRIMGIEALIRWDHSKHGSVNAEKIISIAEESDLILELGRWVIENAFAQLNKWLKQFVSPLHLAVNLSPRQFDHKFDCISFIKQQLSHYQIPDNSIHLEITENLMLEESKHISDTLTGLKAIGLSLSVDDFGTGYSSLSYLRRFPIDYLKIDQSFIKDLSLSTGDETLVKAIIAMGKSLGLKVIAEGVETKNQLDFLKAHDCNYCQGYYFSKPLSVENMTHLLEKNSQKSA